MPHVSKHNNLTKKGKKTATATAPEPEPPAHLAFQEAHYNDEDVVRDFSDLLSRTCRVWNDGSFHSDMMNGGTGAMFNNGHHIPDGGAKTPPGNPVLDAKAKRNPNDKKMTLVSTTIA
ncbi:predicted protein [Pyrenophora tritici-repentis Pt-1C-BFP]|uniref:Uncharacterized protein n=1 Tax=Pyrenophora tritici-repentis (strain Pt-1C-BFP) TaxID=426418 RepID=B2W4Y6_PYRTR|nr:uncharacterized protein PTRG_04686 [Pyrenophora tritici-repentis Pt-1C-BFP]EDU47593.1 predicted protein [Pyrenophora tritici-repentis Pt-1C-BFP]